VLGHKRKEMKLYNIWLHSPAMSLDYRQNMASMLLEAINKNKKIYTWYQGITKTPIQFMEHNLKGELRWGSCNWSLVD